MDLKMILFSLLLFGNVYLISALRFLVFVPIWSKSHSLLGYGVVDNLLEAGHEVVHVTSFPRENMRNNNYTVVDVSEIGRKVKAEFLNHGDGYTIKNLIKRKLSPIAVMEYVYQTHKQALETEEVIKLFSDPRQKFDGVVLDWIYSNFIAGIAPLFQCPLIWLGTTEAYWQMLELVDEIPNPAFHVDQFSVNLLPLSFWDRVEELFIIIKRFILTRLYITPREVNTYHTIFSRIAEKRGVVLPPYDDALYNASLLLINSHPSIGILPFRLPQNAKYIAGYHIPAEIAPLPKDHQKAMDEAKHGVIYFSMGSNLKSVDMTEKMRNSLMKMFSQLKETVVWKFEADLENVPENVHLVKWAPQHAILNHTNTKLFISHGGQLSTTEAIHFGVPVIGMPLLGDQHVNMNSVLKKGFGIKVQIKEETLASDLLEAINEIKTNPKYRNTAKELSMIYHHRIQPPAQEMVFWIEHVVATRGALHLRSPALSVPLYKKLYLDFLALLLISIYLLRLVLSYRMCWFNCRFQSKHKNKFD